MSPPAWGRGLKPEQVATEFTEIMSPPAWGRGLKLAVKSSQLSIKDVAPRVGAWIETLYSYS